jgi:8-oxo-dGTP diphosphatase
MKHYACAILLDDPRILLGKRTPHRHSYANRWDVIGGKVEAGETLGEALVRELVEEIGVIPTAYESLGPIVDRNPEAKGDSTYHMFVVISWTGGPPIIEDNEHSTLQWFAVEEACALPELALPEYITVFRSISIP